MTPQSQRPSESERKDVEAKLLAVERQLQQEMLARGFDPSQGENVALTAPLAKLYMERESLRAKLDEFNETGD